MTTENFILSLFWMAIGALIYEIGKQLVIAWRKWREQEGKVWK